MDIKKEKSSKIYAELRLVWAKMRYCCYWPARVVETPPALGKTPAKKTCVLFFGSKTYGFVDLDKLEDYSQCRAKFVSKGRGKAFKEAVKDIDDFISDPQKFHSNAYAKPINNVLKIKTEENMENILSIKQETNTDIAEQDMQASMQATPATQTAQAAPATKTSKTIATKSEHAKNKVKEDRNKTVCNDHEAKICLLNNEKQNLIAELVLVKSDYQRCFYDLQKKDEALKSLTVHKEKMEHCLNHRITTLSKELNLTKAEIPSLKKKYEKQEMEDKKTICKLSRENKFLQARFEQIRFGISQAADENKNTASTADSQKNCTSENDNTSKNVYEVEKLLGHKLKRKQRHFLVRWKGFDSSHDTWEPEQNLNCPKILQGYIKSNVKN